MVPLANWELDSESKKKLLENHQLSHYELMATEPLIYFRKSADPNPDSSTCQDSPIVRGGEDSLSLKMGD